MMKSLGVRKWLLAVLMLGGATLLSAPAMAQNLRIGLGSDPDALDPTLSRTVAGRVVFAALCDKLIDIDEKLNYVPQLATAWEWSADGKTLTLKLRGVFFSIATLALAIVSQAVVTNWDYVGGASGADGERGGPAWAAACVGEGCCGAEGAGGGGEAELGAAGPQRGGGGAE